MMRGEPCAAARVELEDIEIKGIGRGERAPISEEFPRRYRPIHVADRQIVHVEAAARVSERGEPDGVVVAADRPAVEVGVERRGDLPKRRRFRGENHNRKRSDEN